MMIESTTSTFKVLTSTEGLPYEDWLEYRRLGLGGSDASVVCGINRYKSPIELFMEKTGMFPHSEAGEAAYWGTQLEALVRAEFIKRTGIEVIQVNQILRSEEYPFMQANLDGICEHPIYGTCVFEAKTTSRGAYIAVLIGGNTFKWKFIERDDDVISMLIQIESDFWNRVQSNVPPPIDGSEASAKFLSERFPNSITQTKINLPESTADLIRQYQIANEQIDHYTEQKDEAASLLKQILGEHEAG